MFWAVIVTFNPNVSQLKKLIDTLSEIGVHICLVDNFSNGYKSSDLSNSGFHSINLKRNEGIALAQNIGIKHAIESKADYILFFDQDSSISNDYVEKIYTDYNALKMQSIKVGAIGPRFVDERFGFFYKTVNMDKNGFREKLDVSNITESTHSSLLISSGSLIAVSTLKDVGYMRANYFIDYVDTEWCIRAESLGYRNYVSVNAVMKHSIGDNVLQFKYFNVPVHSAFRRYYRVRNAFFMLREPHVPKLLALREIIFTLVHQIILIAFLKQKKQYIQSYFRGIKDGIFNYKVNKDE
jgi:rhamnosyltransferase